MNKYLKIFELQIKEFLQYKDGLIFEYVIMYLRILLPYGILLQLANTGQITSDLVHLSLWAVIFGQTFNTATKPLEEEIKDEIRSGNIAVRLSEPINYFASKFVAGYGYFSCSLIVSGLVFILPLTFVIPADFNLFLAIFIGIFTSAINFLFKILLGLSSFVIEDNQALVWIYNKFIIIFGNQIFPVFLLPEWFYNIAKLTTFYLMLSAPVEVASGRYSPVIAISLLLGYSVLLYFIISYLFNKLRKNLIQNG